MALELFHQGTHRCVLFNDLVRGDDGIQANQMLIQHGDQAALLDPGGALLYTPLSLAVARYLPTNKLSYIIASHQDPDVIGSVDRWLMYTHAKIVCSRLWGRFVPHSVPHYLDTGDDRYVLVPDEGMRLPFGDSHLQAIPAHFLHSVGNFHTYDPVSRILFTGDMGASTTDSDGSPVQDFEAHIGSMLGFHRRYMASNKACRLWVNRVRKLDIEALVPQHGQPMVGKDMVQRFLNWIEELPCGLDLMQDDGGLPKASSGGVRVRTLNPASAST